MRHDECFLSLWHRAVRNKGEASREDLKFKGRGVSVFRSLILTALEGRRYGRSEAITWGFFRVLFTEICICTRSLVLFVNFYFMS